MVMKQSYLRSVLFCVTIELKLLMKTKRDCKPLEVWGATGVPDKLLSINSHVHFPLYFVTEDSIPQVNPRGRQARVHQNRTTFNS